MRKFLAEAERLCPEVRTLSGSYRRFLAVAAFRPDLMIFVLVVPEGHAHHKNGISQAGSGKR
jgi:hypothetical protein